MRVVVAESGPVAARVSAGSTAVAAAPGSAAAGLPSASHGRRLQLLPHQQLCPLLQHYAAIPWSAADVKDPEDGRRTPLGVHSWLPQLHASCSL